MKLLKATLYIYFFLCLAATPLLGNDKISPEASQKLEQFFEFLIHNSSIGYSLCGNKPISIEMIPPLAQIPAIYSTNIFFEQHNYSVLMNGKTVWFEYHHLFPSKNFKFLFVEKYNMLVFININETRKIIKSNIELFRKNTNTDASVDEFLEKICHLDNGKFDLLSNQTLLGILLGYGRNNSVAFSNRGHFQKLVGFDLLETDNCLSNFLNPGFMIVENGIHEEENEALKLAYKQGYIKMRSVFGQKGKYLESFVNIFTHIKK